MKRVNNSIPIPAWWQSTEEQMQAAVDRVTKGEVGCLSISPGKRPVRTVTYGEKDSGRLGTANFNSALAARKPEAYSRRGNGSGMRPVLVVLAGVHGQEVEGMVAAASLISVLETGRDAMGCPQPALAGKLGRLRVIVIPLANPDGRARVPYTGWAGLPVDEMTKWGQGTNENGQPWGWPGCKAVHPMLGDVGILGGYFDDNGVNMMHDEWSAPMSEPTKALLGLVASEAPDCVLNLHSHGFDPCILGVGYIPLSAKKTVRRFARRCYARMVSMGYHTGALPGTGVDGPCGEVPPPFNLDSMLYHTGAGLPILYESPHGCIDGQSPYGYEDLLRLHHLLFESAVDELLR